MTRIPRPLRKLSHFALGDRVYEATTAALRDTPRGVLYLSRSAGRVSAQRLREKRNTHVSQRCFIIGNGPSLNDQDLSLLRNESSFVLNRGYLLHERMGGPATFLVAVNDHVLRQFANEIADVDSMKFISWRARRLFHPGRDLVLVRSRTRAGFHGDSAPWGVWEGATVTFVALQIAYYLGFAEVILIGVDHYFGQSGPPHAAVVSEADDLNHFDPRYFGPWTVWQYPDLQTSEKAYGFARQAFERAGRRVVNATHGGQLDVFPRVVFEDLF